MKSDKRGTPPAGANQSSLSGNAAETVRRGLVVAPGIAIGPTHVVDIGSIQVPEYVVLPAELEAEGARFAEAVAKSLRQIRKLPAKAKALPEAAAEEIAYLLEAHAAILSRSRLLPGVERRLAEDRFNAETAVQAQKSSVQGDRGTVQGK